jgi:hypothetical protein
MGYDDQMNEKDDESPILAWYQTRKNPSFLAQFSNSPWTGGFVGPFRSLGGQRLAAMPACQILELTADAGLDRKLSEEAELGPSSKEICEFGATNVRSWPLLNDESQP